MENKPHEYILKDFTRLPQNMLFDFSKELSELRALQVLHFPFFTDEKYETIVKFLISALTHQLDAEYAIASTVYDILDRYYPKEFTEGVEREQVSKCLITTTQKILLRLIDTKVYLGGIFPYLPDILYSGGGVLFSNSKYLNYETELICMDKPFQFNQY